MPLLAKGPPDQNKLVNPDFGKYTWPSSLAVSDADQKPGNLSTRSRCSAASGVAWRGANSSAGDWKKAASQSIASSAPRGKRPHFPNHPLKGEGMKFLFYTEQSNCHDACSIAVSPTSTDCAWIHEFFAFFRPLISQDRSLEVPR
jgi:hypothetical protein